MKTIILPGYSPHNKDWADELKRGLDLGHEVIVHNWEHWKTGKSLSPGREVVSIMEEVGNNKVNIVAKSVGTFIAVKLLPKLGSKVGKVILCGIPSTSEKRKDLYKGVFSKFTSYDLICFQNRGDPFATYSEVKSFMANINPNIRVIEKERNDHSYPYPEDFSDFLKN